MGLVILTGKELKAEIVADHKCFSEMDETVVEWYGERYASISEEKYYLVTSELSIIKESELSQILSDGVSYEHEIGQKQRNYPR